MMFEEQSAGICSSSLPPTADGVTSVQNPISPPPQANQRQFASGESSSQKKKGVCFKCGKEEGHWAKECPMNSPSNRSPPLPPAADDFPIVHCICGVPCDVKVSRTQKNPGREFFTCSLPFAKKCGFFLWCKDAPKGENIKTQICGCGAGPCHIYKETSGQDAGRKFFVCPIKKGQGACSFVQPVDSINNLVDEQLLDSTNHATLDLLEDQLVDVTNDFWNEAPSSPPSTLTSCGDTSPSSIELVEEGNSSHQGMEIESPLVDTPEHSRKLGTNVEFSRTERGSLVDLQGLEDMSEEPLRKNCKRLRHGYLKIPSFIMDSVSDCLLQTKSTGLTTEKALRPSILTSGALICQKQVKFLRQISSAGASLPGGVFPSFDIISLPGDADLPIEICRPSSVESTQLSLVTPFQPSGAVLYETSGLKPPPKDFPGRRMKESVLDKFKQAAVSLQVELLSLLESMDCHDHGSMLEESYSVFGALERLSVDYEPFKEQVLKYIGHAASFAEVELSIHNGDQSSQDLFGNYNHKKLQLEDIARHHADTSSALEVSNEHIQYLQQEVSRLKNMLLHVEEELAFCKVEHMEIDTRFNQLAEDKLQSEVNLQAAFNEAEEAKKVCQQREAERIIAKASFEKARSELRQSCSMLFLM